MGHKIIDGILWLVKVVIGLTIVLVILANAPGTGDIGSFAGDVLHGVGGTIVQLPDILKDARGASA
jgi:hypothetical protein